ncbi:hypothetical protein RND81_13G033100 [Saponaria officinalis]|uniref:Late embryogenesis abundant protein LEA-2 subgroup domain-containing protein n=1 Tax=Saponaria officinalis TaxID=3572 RepID=A0AAW1GVJ9_SAPOF
MVKNYPKNLTQNSSSSMMILPIYNPQKTQKKSNKCFVYTLATIVLLFAVLLIFSCIVILVKNPTLKINSFVINSLNYDNTPTFNLNTLMKISIKNRNFGYLDFDNKINNTISIIYGNGSVLGTSELKFSGNRVGSRSEEEIQLKMNLSYLKDNFNGFLNKFDGMKFEDDLNLGYLEFIGYANFRGNVHLFKNKVIRRAIVHMNCSIGIDLRKQLVERLIC